MSLQSEYENLGEFKATNGEARIAAAVPTQSSENAAVTLATDAYFFAGVGTPAGNVPLDLAVAIQLANAAAIRKSATLASASTLADFDSTYAGVAALLAADEADFTKGEQKTLFGKLVTDVTGGALAAAIADATAILRIPSSGYAVAINADGSFTTKMTESGATFTTLWSSTWQPETLDVTASSITQTTSFALREIIRPNGHGTEHVTFLGNFGPVVVGSNITRVTLGSPTDTAATNYGGVSAETPVAVVNYGTILGLFSSVSLGDGGSLINGSTTDTTATIEANVVFGGTSGGRVRNFGTIESLGVDSIISLGAGGTVINGSEADTGATINNDIVFGGTQTSRLTNFGTILEREDFAITDGSLTGGTPGGPLVITNGSASDTKASITGMRFPAIYATGAARLTNFGTIDGATAIFGGGPTYQGVELLGASSITNGSTADTTASLGPNVEIGEPAPGVTTVRNFGTISGSLQLDDGGTIRNAGTIGSVLIEKGTSRLIEEQKSAITGQIQGDGAGTTIELAPGKSGSIGGGFADVGSVSVDACAEWTVSGSVSVADVANDGTITVGAGDRLDVSSTVSRPSTGLFELEDKGTLEVAAVLGAGSRIAFLGTPGDDLVIDAAASFGTRVGSACYAGPRLEDFGAGDTIDLKGIAESGLRLSYASASGDVQITGSSGGALATLRFDTTTLGAGTFHTTSDGAGGTLLTRG